MKPREPYRWWLRAFFALLLVFHADRSLAACKSAVRIETSNAVGTGVVVTFHGKVWLLTAYHVLRGQRCTPGNECIYVAAGPDHLRLKLGDITEKTIRVFPSLGTIALPVSEGGVKALTDAEVVPVELKDPVPDPEYEGRSVLAVGNPEYDYLRTHIPFINYAGGGQVGAYEEAALVLGVAVRPVAAKTKLLFIDGSTITHGYSGGPVFDESFQGDLIGIVQGGDPSIGTRSWAVPAQEIAAALNGNLGVKLNVPFRSSPNWPEDGFAASLYARQKERVDLITITPSPLTVERGESFTIQIRTPVSVVKARPVEDVIVESEQPPVTDEATNQTTYRWTFRLAEQFHGNSVHIPFEVRRVDSGAELESLVVDGSVDCHRLSIAEGIGWDWLAPPHATSAQRLRIRVDGAYTLLGTCTVCVAARVGVAAPFLIAKRDRYAPFGDQVLEHDSPAVLPGFHMEAMIEGRLFDSAVVSPRLAFGIAYEAYFYRLPESALRDGNQGVLTFPIEASLAIRSPMTWLLRARLTREALPTLDTRYVGPADGAFPELRPLSQPTHWMLGLAVEVEHGI